MNWDLLSVFVLYVGRKSPIQLLKYIHESTLVVTLTACFQSQYVLTFMHASSEQPQRLTAAALHYMLASRKCGRLVREDVYG